MRGPTLVISTVVAVGVVVAAPPPAQAALPPAVVSECGTVVSGHAVLADDLVCEAGDGVTLADGASLDLRGHRLVGPGAGDGFGSGVVVPFAGGATVRNGTVEGWAAGVQVALDFAPGEGTVVLDRLHLRDNAIAVDASIVMPGPRFEVTRSTLEDNDVAVSAGISTSVDVTSSRLTGNRLAVGTDEGGHVGLVRSRVDHNEAVAETGFGGGVSVTDSVVSDNASGITIGQGGASLTDSVFARNGSVVWVSSFFASLEMRGNTVRDNGTAVEVVDAYAVVVGNRFVGNDVAYTGSNLFDDGVQEVVGNGLRRNRDALLSEGTVTVADNTAVRNTGRGIHAPGAIDGGGNRAWGNGTEPQCVGVVCEGRGSGPSS